MEFNTETAKECIRQMREKFPDLEKFKGSFQIEANGHIWYWGNDGGPFAGRDLQAFVNEFFGFRRFEVTFRKVGTEVVFASSKENALYVITENKIEPDYSSPAIEIKEVNNGN